MLPSVDILVDTALLCVFFSLFLSLSLYGFLFLRVSRKMQIEIHISHTRTEQFAYLCELAQRFHPFSHCSVHQKKSQAEEEAKAEEAATEDSIQQQ